MRVLLDTHVVLWWYDDPQVILSESRRIIEDPNNEIYLSPIVIWEILIKSSLKKLSVSDKLFDKAAADFTELPLTINHSKTFNAIKKIHNDPFDLLLIAQAKAEDLFLMTRDKVILKYDIKFLKA